MKDSDYLMLINAQLLSFSVIPLRPVHPTYQKL